MDFAPLVGLRSRADIVFTRARVAVYLDFWHGCPIHGTTPKTNASYWVPKLERNRAWDLEVTAALTEAGWTVMRFWEHEDEDPVVDAVRTFLSRKGTPD